MKREIKIDLIAFFAAFMVSYLFQYVSTLSIGTSKGERLIIFSVTFLGFLIYYEVLKISRGVKIK